MKKHSENLKKLANTFMSESVTSDYSYNFEWPSRPIIQYPYNFYSSGLKNLKQLNSNLGGLNFF